MFGKITKCHGSALIEVEIISSVLPATMPVVSDDIENLGDGYTLAPGSVMIVTGTDKRYILGTDGTWEELPAGGGGGDLSAYQTKALSSSVTIGAETETTVEGAIGAAADVIPSTATAQNKLATAADVENLLDVITATGTTLVLGTTEADLFKLSVKGKSEVVSGQMVNVGASGITITATDGTSSETATITTAHPYRAPSDEICDSIDRETGNVVTACGEVDLGSLSWSKNNNNEFVARLAGRSRESEGSPKYMLCTKYAIGHSATRADKTIWREYHYTNEDVVVKDSDYASSTAAQFKTAVTGEKLVYKLQTDVVTALSDAEKAALAALKTYDGTTTISSTDSPEITVEYLANTTNGKAIGAVIDMVDGKTDKVTSATSGNFAGLDSNGNLTDSGSKAADFAAASHNQASSTINAMTGYEKPQSTSAISTSDTLNQAIGKLEKALDSAGGGSADVGDIKLTGRSTAPAGWLICDGSAISRTTYADLFAAIGTAFGTGDGSTTFNLPNLAGKTALGANSSHAIGSTGGAETQTITANNLPKHTHPMGSIQMHVQSSSSMSPSGNYISSSSGKYSLDTWTQSGDTGQNSSSATALNIMSPYCTVNYIIYAGV